MPERGAGERQRFQVERGASDRVVSMGISTPREFEPETAPSARARRASGRMGIGHPDAAEGFDRASAIWGSSRNFGEDVGSPLSAATGDACVARTCPQWLPCEEARVATSFPDPRIQRRVRVAAITLLAAVAVVLVSLELFDQVIAPMAFAHYEHNPTFARLPTRTLDRGKNRADPVNVALVGTAEEVATAFAKAGWSRADSLSRRSDLGIATSVLLDRPDSTAPVSSLFLYGRRQDAAFEREVGRSARRRHHVRLWLADGVTDHGRPVWIGDAAYDLRAGLSHRTWGPTHHIEADVDRERDTVLANLTAAGQLVERYSVTGMGPHIDARNAEGDRFDTDGELDVGVISPGNAAHGPPAILPDPRVIQWKNSLWRAISHL
jgi:hypothetical protein